LAAVLGPRHGHFYPACPGLVRTVASIVVRQRPAWSGANHGRAAWSVTEAGANPSAPGGMIGKIRFLLHLN